MKNTLTDEIRDIIRSELKHIRLELNFIIKALEELQKKDNNLNIKTEKSKREILLEEEEELFDRKLTEKALKVSNATLSKFIKEGLITPQTLGRKHFYLKSDVEYLESILVARGWYERNMNNRDKQKN